MNKKFIYVLTICLVSFNGYSQSIESLLQSIKANNPMIRANTKWLESEMTGSRTGIYPDNPEITYNYLWGIPEAIGNQKELEITQKLKFPGYYFAVSSRQKKEYSASEILVEKFNNEVLLRAKNEIAILIWLTKKQSVLENKIKESSELLAMTQEGYNRNEFSKPAFDKVRIYNLNNQTELANLKSDILVHSEILQQLNGGIPIDMVFDEYDRLFQPMPDYNFLNEKIPVSNPDIKMARIGKDISTVNVRVENMNRLPRIEAGYKSETILNQKLQGVHTGISIPLWENNGKVKQARVAENWSNLNYEQVVSEITSNLKAAYTKAETAFQNYKNIREIIDDSSISRSTFQLLKAGEISFPEYLTEVQLIYENQLNFLESERDYVVSLNIIQSFLGEGF